MFAEVAPHARSGDAGVRGLRPSANVGVAPSGAETEADLWCAATRGRPDEFTIYDLDWGLGSGRRGATTLPDNGLAELVPPSQPEGIT